MNLSFGEKEIRFIDSQPNDVYYISFGTQFSPPNKHFIFLKNFLKQKIEKERNISLLFCLTNKEQNTQTKEEFKGFKNVMVSEWVNQRAILNHKKVKIFFSHGGLSSIIESVFENKPLFVFPLGGDQFFNAIRVKELGLGEYIDFWTLEENILEEILKKMEKNYKRYQENSKKISRLNNLIGGEKVAADLIEAFHISPHIFLDSSLGLGVVVKYSLDIVFVVVLVLCFLIYLFSKICCRCNSKKIQKKKEKLK